MAVLIQPGSGKEIQVPDERVEQWLEWGYRRADAPAPVKEPTKRPARKSAPK